MSATVATWRIPRLLSITPPGGSLDAYEVAIANAGFVHGHALLYRRPKLEPRTLLDEGRRVRALARSVRAAFFVSRRVDVARVLEADGVHLGESSVSPQDARRLFAGVIGASRHDAAGLRACEADYATLSPYAETPDKGPRLGRESFAAALRGARIPVLALGGVDESNAPEAIGAGARGLAVIRGVLHPGPAEFGRILDSAGLARE